MKPPVIVQIVQRLAPGGIETLVLDLKRSLPETEQIHIVSLEGTETGIKQGWSTLNGINNIHTVNKQPGIQWSTVSQLAQLLRSLQADIVHSHHVGPLLYGGLAAKWAGCSHIHTEHDTWHLTNLKRRLLVGSLFYSLKPTIIADAQRVEHSLNRYIPALSTSVIVNGVDTDRFHPGHQLQARKHLGLPLDASLIGCAARLAPVKSHATLLSALSRMPSDIHLALAGEGELEQALRQQASGLNIADRVHFLGNLNAMTDFYQAVDVFCLASEQEGLPLAPLEAQACGTNVVLTDVGACSEAVSPDYGLLVPANDGGSLAKALLRQLKEGCSNVAREKAREFIVNERSLTTMAAQYQSVYHQMIKVRTESQEECNV